MKTELQSDLTLVFKRDDIRGKHPDYIDVEFAFALGSSLVKVFSNLLMKDPTELKFKVGRDDRISSAALSDALIKGITAAGASAEFIGLVSTEVLYFSVGDDLTFSGGIMITASHNPKDENGFKIVKQGAEIASGKDLETIRNEVEKYLPNSAVISRYAAKVIQISGIESIQLPDNSSPIPVVVEAGNGVGGLVFKSIAERLPFVKVYYKHDLPDGRFENILPNPLNMEYMDLLEREVVANNADLGYAFDGDADRVGIVINGARWDKPPLVLSASETAAIIAKQFLSQKPTEEKMEIMYNLVTSCLVSDTIEASGGSSLMTPVGHGQIKQIMRHENHREVCPFACEHSGHYFFRDFFYADSAMVAALKILAIILPEPNGLENLYCQVEEWRKSYFLANELNFGKEIFSSRNDMQAAVMRVLEAAKTIPKGLRQKIYSANKESIKPSGGVDTVKMEFEESFGSWWFCVRASGNEEILRLNAEVIIKPDNSKDVDGKSFLAEKVNWLKQIIESKK